jgi:hypothetical protein
MRPCRAHPSGPRAPERSSLAEGIGEAPSRISSARPDPRAVAVLIRTFVGRCEGGFLSAPVLPSRSHSDPSRPHEKKSRPSRNQNVRGSRCRIGPHHLLSAAAVSATDFRTVCGFRGQKTRGDTNFAADASAFAERRAKSVLVSTGGAFLVPSPLMLLCCESK